MDSYKCITKFYSLGQQCGPRTRIDYYKNIKNIEICETNFFDYLMVDVNAIINIFDNDNLFDLNNYEIYNITDNNICIRHINLALMSIHDVPNNVSYDNDNLINKKIIDIEDNNLKSDIVKNFFDKYKRRHERLINLLKNNHNIFFIYQGDISYEEYLKIKNIFFKYTSKKILIISFSDFGEKYRNY